MRKLARIVTIDAIDPIEGADAIEVATVGGWKVVVRKGEYAAEHHAVYIEIDSWIPHTLAPLLSGSSGPKTYNGVEGNRLRTVKLRGQISQGLLLPLDAVPTTLGVIMTGEDGDITELLGIQKWEAPIPAQLQGEVFGFFPIAIPKTDQERCQNLVNDLKFWGDSDLDWEVSEKFDGTSATYFLDDEHVFHVCSRNLDLKPSETNTYWKIANMYNIEKLMRDNSLVNIAIQGEIIGEGIQKNPYKLKGQDFFVFDVYDANKFEYLGSEKRRALVDKLGLKHVPILAVKFNPDVDTLLKMAEGKSVLNTNAEREGLVFKDITGEVSFKAISNKFLLKGD
jgi:RNA ligase (TIGR02306 family)